MSQRLKSNPTEQRIFYPSFDGGLNLSVPPESLARNELKEALNVEYSARTGAMTVRGGLFHHEDMGIYSEEVTTLPGKRGFLSRGYSQTSGAYHSGLRIFTSNRMEYVTRTLTGIRDISSCEWDGYHLIASGGKLQKLRNLDTWTLETIESSPAKCLYVFVRSGRVGVVTEDNEIRFSALGDCESWENDPNDDSTGQFVEIGYKDGMNIDAVIPLSRDLIVFKSPNGEPDKGIIYRLTGDYPNWAVVEAAHNIGTYSQRSVQAVGNEVYFATVSGIASLSAVTSYGEIQAQWPDRKVNSALSEELNGKVQLWNIPIKQQLWIKPHNGAKTIWVLDYVRGIWTKFEFPGEVVYADGSCEAVYLYLDNRGVYEQIAGKVTDTISEGSEQAITAKMTMGTLLTGNQVLIRRAFVSFGMQPESRAELKLGNFTMNFSHDMTSAKVYGNSQKALKGNDEIGGTQKTITSRRMCMVRGWSITPQVTMTGGGCSLSTMGLEASEV